MAPKVHNIFQDFAIEVAIPAQHALTGAQKIAVETAYANSSERAIQFHCAVAEAANKALGVEYDRKQADRVAEVGPIEFEGVGTFHVNRNAMASFGVNSSGHLFLTIGLVGQHDNLRYRLTWKDTAIPKELAQVAVNHDHGEGHKAVKAALNFADAELTVARKMTDIRPKDEAARTRKNNNRTPGVKRKHRRACLADISRVYA